MALLVLLGGILLFFQINNMKHPLVCVQASKVVDIISLEGRKSTIKLENGKVIQLHGAFLNQGDNYCLKYDRKN